MCQNVPTRMTVLIIRDEECIVLRVLDSETRHCDYMEEGQPSWLGQSSLWRSRISAVKFFAKIYFCLYESRASPLWWDLAINYPIFRLGGLAIFHINAFKRAGPSSQNRDSKSKLRTHDKVCLGQYLHVGINFYFTSFCFLICSLQNENLY